MTLDDIGPLEAEWELDTGFFGKLRRGEFEQTDFRRAIAVVGALKLSEGGYYLAELCRSYGTFRSSWFGKKPGSSKVGMTCQHIEPQQTNWRQKSSVCSASLELLPQPSFRHFQVIVRLHSRSRW